MTPEPDLTAARDGAVTFTTDRSDSAIADGLLRAFATETAELYPEWGRIPEADRPSTTPDEMAPPRGSFLVAWRDGEPVACGGVRAFDEGTAEVKRLYVSRAARDGGVGWALLRALEDTAHDLGYRRVRLDTGSRQPLALRLFRACGYREIADYNGNPFASHWFEKALGSPGVAGPPPTRTA